MDAVVDYIPPKFGMLLSRSWDSKLKGILQMDMSYATILVFGDQRRFYREKQLAYVVNNQNNKRIIMFVRWIQILVLIYFIMM